MFHTLCWGVLPQVSEWFIHSPSSSPASNMSFPDLHSQPLHSLTHVHTHTPHTCICVHIDVHTERHKYMSHTHTCTHKHTHASTRIHIHEHMEKHVYVYMCIETLECKHAYTETQAHTCAYINTYTYTHIQFSSIQLLSRVRLFATPWTAARQACLSITSSQSLLRLTSIESVMPSNQLILCRPLLLPPSISPSIRVFPNESVLRFRWPQDWSFSFSLSPSSEYSGPISHWSVVAFQYGVSFSAVNQL